MNEKQNKIAKSISSVVTSHYGVTLKFLFQKTRKRDVVFKRQLLQQLLKKHTKLTLGAIGNLYKEEGSTYEHCTIKHSVKTIDNQLDVDKSFRKEYDIINEKIIAKIQEIELKEKKKEEFIKQSKLPKSFLDLRRQVVKACRISKSEDILKNELIELL